MEKRNPSKDYPTPINFKPTPRSFNGDAMVYDNAFPTAKANGRVSVPRQVEEPTVPDPFEAVDVEETEVVEEVNVPQVEEVEAVVDDAVEEAIEEVIEEPVEEVVPEPQVEEPVVEVAPEPASEVAAVSVDALELDKDVEEVFVDANIFTTDDMVAYWTENKSFTPLKGIGPKTNSTIIEKLAERGIILS